MRSTSQLLACLVVVHAFRAVLAGEAEPSSGIPPHPRDLVFPEFRFEAPEAAAHRHVLDSGPVVFVVEDRELPLVDVEITVRTGAYLDPTGLEGLAEVTAAQMRSGGTQSIAPDEFDEELDFLAADLRSSARPTEASASLNCLSKDLARVLDLFFQMVRSPRFDEKRLEIQRAQILQGLARRNDDTAGIESREWDRLMRGPGAYTGQRLTKASIEKISRADLAAFHRKYWWPGNFVVAVSGDISTMETLADLDRRFREWNPGSEAVLAPRPSKPEHAVVPGVYVVDKPDVNQGRVAAGHASAMRGDPRFPALYVMNDILGGGGFTSRIMGRVRSDMGLAYSAGSRFEFGVWYPGDFRAAFQSKSESTVDALGVVLEEIRRIRTEEVSDEELRTAVSSAIGEFPQYFANARRTAATFANDEFSGRDPLFWKTYRERMEAVTAADVKKAAAECLHPDGLAILIVGNASAILTPEATKKLADWLGPKGEARRIPLPDPMTLEYPDR